MATSIQVLYKDRILPVSHTPLQRHFLIPCQTVSLVSLCQHWSVVKGHYMSFQAGHTGNEASALLLGYLCLVITPGLQIIPGPRPTWEKFFREFLISFTANNLCL